MVERGTPEGEERLEGRGGLAAMPVVPAQLP